MLRVCFAAVLYAEEAVIPVTATGPKRPMVDPQSKVVATVECSNYPFNFVTDTSAERSLYINFARPAL